MKSIYLHLCSLLAASCGLLAAVSAQAEVRSLAEMPVAACADKAYLSDMDGRPWWNKAWKKRAAILVSNMSKVRTRKTTIDFVFDAALMVVQENVLGTGKVIFTQNTNSFTSWYENLDHGDAVLSFMLGMPVKHHAEKVMQMNGGIGTVVK